GQQPLHFSFLYLDPRHVAVVADAHLAEAKPPDSRLRGPDPGQGVCGHLGAVWDTRGQAGERRLVPRRPAKATGGGPGLPLPPPRLEEREADAATHCRAVTGAVVGRVIGGGAVGQVRQAQLLADRLQSLEQLFLAVVAAVRQVAAVSLQLYFVGLYFHKPCAHRARQLARVLLFLVRIGGGVRLRRGRPPRAPPLPRPPYAATLVAA